MRLFAAALRPYGLSPFGSHRLRAAAAIAGHSAMLFLALADRPAGFQRLTKLG
jgi:hypothetical protein